MIDFFYVNPEYINYLQNREKEERGFTRVPNMQYGEANNEKFVVGAVFQIGEHKYYAPISHYKKPRPNNILINIATDKKNPIKGSIRLNYMFPASDDELTKVEINQIPDDKFKRLLQKELRFCKENEIEIQNKALVTYLEVLSGSDTKLIENACNFKLLENALLERKNPPPPNDGAEDADKGLVSV